MNSVRRCAEPSPAEPSQAATDTPSASLFCLPQLAALNEEVFETRQQLEALIAAGQNVFGEGMDAEELDDDYDGAGDDADNFAESHLGGMTGKVRLASVAEMVRRIGHCFAQARRGWCGVATG